ncbi:nuclease-related domain-containing protein [Bacillus sp. Marseille-Q3570]|uniref:nuclease-related domain-containing protein n=1 Tax=Bacillus sp. Marseille-Q3570 TaxID=2963522 RepID=UPI0021B7026F|nr:nuclease-related domain-containing protein [Bacillus sp. Marseille-Q3570]
MFKKKLQIPLNLLQLIALRRRIPPDHPKYPQLLKSYNKLRKGYRGEKKIEYQLRYLDANRYYIFHDIRLPIGNTHFQIDFLLLSPFLNIIVESKNIGGTLYFDPVFKQLIRRKPDGSEDVFPDPTLQVERQQSQLNKWLVENNLPTNLVEYLIGVSDSNTILKTSLKNHNISKWIVHQWSIAFKIEGFEKNYTHAEISEKDLKRIIRKILKKNEPQIEEILDNYNISDKEIVTGVQCTECFRFKMIRLRNKWKCPQCNFESKTAHQSAISDYALLMNPTFANRQIRPFLDGISPKTTNYLLNKMNIKKEGRKYFLNPQQIYDYADKGELTDD